MVWFMKGIVWFSHFRFIHFHEIADNSNDSAIESVPKNTAALQFTISFLGNIFNIMIMMFIAFVPIILTKFLYTRMLA